MGFRQLLAKDTTALFWNIDPAPVRRMAMLAAFALSPMVLSATSPIFPVLHYEPYSVGSSVQMADGDVNGDGVNDTVYISASTNVGVWTVTTALRSKSGAVSGTVLGGTIPCLANSLLFADLNKDGKLDAVVTCGSGSVAVLQGNGDGTFQSASLYPVANAANAVAADLNGDGFLDVLVAMNSGNNTSTFAVLLNGSVAGTIRLGTAVVYGGATGSPQIMTGDLNGDGKIDVVAGGISGNFTGSSAGIFYGKGDGTL